MKKIKSGEITMQLRHRIFSLVIVPFAVLALTSCSDDPSTKNQDSIVTAGPVSDYDLAESIIPFPNDLLLQGTADGTLNIPVADETDLSDPQVALNALDGFSTNAPMSTGFSDALDAASISGTSVRVYEVVKGGGLAGPVTSVTKKLESGVDYVAAVSSVDSTGSTLVILPLKPLLPKTSYAVLVTKALTGTDGKTVAISNSYALTRGLTELVVSPPSSPISNDDILIGSLKADAGATQTEIDEAYTTAATLDGLRSIVVNPSETALIAADADTMVSSDVILHWTFTTLSTTDVLEAVRTINVGAVQSAGFLPTAPTTSPLGAADIHVGAVIVPYYLTKSDTATSPSIDPTALGSCWNALGGPPTTCATGPHPSRYNPTLVSTAPAAIPMMVSIPKTSTACTGMPTPGWPVVIYQHGITSNRTSMLAIADSMAAACIAVVAIDMPMHGVTGNETNGTELFKNPAGNGGERTFDLDLVTQDADGNIIAAAPDGVIDSSGRHFINLTNLLNTRDNVRQAVADLFVVADAIQEGALTDGTNFMNPGKVYFLGHSLGAMVGTTFLALEPTVKAAAFAFGGSGIAKIIDGSATIGPSVAAGLAAKGVIKGTPDYEAFVGAVQTVIDSADPVNHAFAASHPELLDPPKPARSILFFEIVGGNSSPSDLVVPNRVPDGNDTTGTVPGPLAGTEPQLALMGLTQVNETTASATEIHVVTKFISGTHSSLLDPGPDAAVTTEMQKQAAGFFYNQGTFLTVTDDTVLQAPAP